METQDSSGYDCYFRKCPVYNNSRAWVGLSPIQRNMENLVEKANKRRGEVVAVFRVSKEQVSEDDLPFKDCPLYDLGTMTPIQRKFFEMDLKIYTRHAEAGESGECPVHKVIEKFKKTNGYRED